VVVDEVLEVILVDVDLVLEDEVEIVVLLVVDEDFDVLIVVRDEVEIVVLVAVDEDFVLEDKVELVVLVVEEVVLASS